MTKLEEFIEQHAEAEQDALIHGQYDDVPKARVKFWLSAFVKMVRERALDMILESRCQMSDATRLAFNEIVKEFELEKEINEEN